LCYGRDSVFLHIFSQKANNWGLLSNGTG